MNTRPAHVLFASPVVYRNTRSVRGSIRDRVLEGRSPRIGTIASGRSYALTFANLHEQSHAPLLLRRIWNIPKSSKYLPFVSASFAFTFELRTFWLRVYLLLEQRSSTIGTRLRSNWRERISRFRMRLRRNICQDKARNLKFKMTRHLSLVLTRAICHWEMIVNCNQLDSNVYSR